MAAIVASNSQPPMIQRVAGLQVKRSQNVKHVAYNDVSNSIKRASNEIHADGELRTNMCASCIGAIASYSLDGRAVGRGSSKFNEYVCCMTHPSLGVSGSQCGRCIGLSRGNDCLDVPEFLQADARPIIKMVPKFNAVLQANASKAYNDYTAADKAIVDEILKIAISFNRRLVAFKRNVTAPTKKRKASGDLSPSTEMADVVQSLKDARSDIAELSMQVSDLTGDMTRLLGYVQRADRIQLQSRARDLWLVETITKIGGAFASIPAFDDVEDSDEE